jgi:hypothetical protein
MVDECIGNVFRGAEVDVGYVGVVLMVSILPVNPATTE